MSNRKKPKSTKSATPSIDVALLTSGRFDLLRKCLKSLEKQEKAPPFNVYILDNGSDTEDRLRNKDIFELPIITKSKRLSNNLGFPKGANECARMGTAPLIMHLSDDIELEPDVLRIVVDQFKDETIGIVGIKLLFPKDSTSPGRPAGKVQHIGLAMDIHGDIVHPLMGWSADHPKCNVSKEVLGVTGACYSIRRDLFNRAGGFYEGYGLGTFEDIDMCFHVRSLGKKVFINTDAVGYHYVGATAEKKQQPFPLQQNSMIFKARWGPSGLFRWSDWEIY